MSLCVLVCSGSSSHTRCALVTGVPTCALPIYAVDGARRSVVDAVGGSVEGKRGTGEADQSAAVPHLARSLAKGIECAAHVDLKVSVKIIVGGFGDH